MEMLNPPKDCDVWNAQNTFILIPEFCTKLAINENRVQENSCIQVPRAKYRGHILSVVQGFGFNLALSINSRKRIMAGVLTSCMEYLILSRF